MGCHLSAMYHNHPESHGFTSTRIWKQVGTYTRSSSFPGPLAVSEATSHVDAFQTCYTGLTALWLINAQIAASWARMAIARSSPFAALTASVVSRTFCFRAARPGSFSSAAATRFSSHSAIFIAQSSIYGPFPWLTMLTIVTVSYLKANNSKKPMMRDKRKSAVPKKRNVPSAPNFTIAFINI